jgi:hypothetical protein
MATIKPAPKETHYSCEPISDLKFLFKKTPSERRRLKGRSPPLPLHHTLSHSNHSSKHRPMGDISPRVDLPTLWGSSFWFRLSVLSPTHNLPYVMRFILLFLPVLMGQVFHHHPWTTTINYLAKITNLTNCWVCPKDLWAQDRSWVTGLPFTCSIKPLGYKQWQKLSATRLLLP